MEQCFVTGAAGFIGSHLVEKLLAEGFQVIGVDAFTDYYNPEQKRSNWQKLRKLQKQSDFTFIEGDLLSLNLQELTRRVDYCFHLAGEPGVRLSWGQNFEQYTKQNLLATQKLLEALKFCSLKKLVYASSSSIYGNCALPMDEKTLPQPISPYGVTKLAAEHLCHTYQINYQVPFVGLRFFTVYGPRQRQDMAFYKMIQSLEKAEVFTVFGDGQQTRDFTYVEDIVQATMAAAKSDVQGEFINLGGGSQVKLQEVIGLLEEISGKKLHLLYSEKQKGDPQNTLAAVQKAQEHLAYHPKTSLYRGLNAQLEWYRSLS